MQKVFESSFEEGFYDYQGIGELTCPNDWTPAWRPTVGPGILHRPEYDAKDAGIGQPEVRTGRYAANFFTVHATHDGCLYRKFKVGKGNGVRASVWCMGVTFDRENKPSGGHGMRVGIDPTGGVDHTASTVLYGDYWSSYMPEWKERVWHQVDVEAVAEADEITVFLHAKNDYPVVISASHWDDFVLEVGGADEVTPPEPPPLDISKLTQEQLESLIRKIVQEELGKA